MTQVTIKYAGATTAKGLDSSILIKADRAGIRCVLAGAVLSLLLTGAAFAQSVEVATCRNPEGRAYRHNSGANYQARVGGWDDDKISNGVVTLRQFSDGSFDVLYVDAFKKPMSVIQDGAKVYLLRRGPSEISLLVNYDGPATEIYSFFNEGDGRSKFTMYSNRIGPGAMSAKSSLMVGTCDFIRFDQIR